MKKILSLIAILLLIGSIAIADTIIDWSQYSDEELETIIDEAYEELDRRIDGGYAASLIKEEEGVSELAERIKADLEKKGTIVDYATIDDITVNPNYGTTRSGDYIALVYMTYSDDRGPKTDGSFLISMSDSIGRIIGENYPSVNILTVFWELPIYDSNAKASFELKDGRMAFTDMFWPKVLSNAR